jgi:hypothetical protein
MLQLWILSVCKALKTTEVSSQIVGPHVRLKSYVRTCTSVLKYGSNNGALGTGYGLSILIEGNLLMQKNQLHLR